MAEDDYVPIPSSRTAGRGTQPKACRPRGIADLNETRSTRCYYPLFLTAVRAGLRRGELVALRYGDLNFGADENDSNRYIIVGHNYVRRTHPNTKSRKTRRVAMSKDLRSALVELRDRALLAASKQGRSDISDDLVFPGPDGGILDPDNLYHRLFIPALTKAGIRKIRLHDLRHTFGSLLIQKGAPLTYVRDQMGHYSIQVTRTFTDTW